MFATGVDAVGGGVGDGGSCTKFAYQYEGSTRCGL